jgi:hypothetical protein
MENPDTDNSDALDEERLAELEQRLKSHKRVINALSIIGPGMSGGVDGGFEYDSSLGQ